MSFLEKLFGKKKLDYQKKYLLQKAAISGTMSRFFQATDRETGQLVGLKIIDLKKMKQVDERIRSAAGKVRKPSEGEITASFNHPYIVHVYDYGLTTRNEPYIVMEYLEGTGLNNILMVKQNLLAGAYLHYIRQAAEALKEVHAKGFIHRDYCPRNLLFSGDGTSLILIDFGLSVPNSPPFTDPGNRTGTVNYMAPELVRRKATSEKLDIFSFGVTMYEMCTRQLPWPRGQSGLAAMAHDSPPTPIEQYFPNIHPLLSKAIHKCMESDVRDRCPSMQEFLRLISRCETDTADGTPPVLLAPASKAAAH